MRKQHGIDRACSLLAFLAKNGYLMLRLTWLQFVRSHSKSVCYERWSHVGLASWGPGRVTRLCCKAVVLHPCARHWPCLVSGEVNAKWRARK